MSWQDIVKKIPIPKETEGNYRGKEPATAEGRYGPQDNSPEAIAREMEERRKEDEEQGIPMMNQYPEKESKELSKLLDDLENNYYDLSQLSADGEIGTDVVEALEKTIKILRPGF